jgi:hypothetical protein
MGHELGTDTAVRKALFVIFIPLFGILIVVGIPPIFKNAIADAALLFSGYFMSFHTKPSA